MNVKLKIFISAFVFISVTIACIIGAQQVDEAAGLVWYSVIPPLLAVTLAILTARFFPESQRRCRREHRAELGEALPDGR